MDWFRVYSSILDKPNVCALDAEVLGYWVLFMAVANRTSPRGTLPTDATELGWAVHRDPKTVLTMRDSLVQVGLLEWDGEILRFHKWNLYQPPSTERTAAHKREHPGTSGNAKKRRATSANKREPREHKREEREEREKRERPPVAPQGAARANNPPEVEQVCQWANGLVTGWGPLAEGACLVHPASWVREACTIAHEAKASRWKFVESILARFVEQDGPDSQKANGQHANPAKGARPAFQATPEQLAKLPEV